MEQNLSYTERIRILRKVIRKWGAQTEKDLLFKLASLKVSEQINLYDQVRFNDYRPLKESIKATTKSGGIGVSRVNISFSRQGIWIEHGVGKNRAVGSSEANKSRKRWIVPVLGPAVNDLGDQIAEAYADIAAHDLRILVPGILDSKIDGRNFVETELDDGTPVKILIDTSFF